MAATPTNGEHQSPEIRPDLAVKRPIIWFGMRKGDKSWVGQEDGIIQISDSILASYSDALILLDGFSRPVGRDNVTQRWESVIEDLRQAAERIRERISRPASVVNMMGNTLRESVLWAELTDIYISPVGSTQHKIGWFSSAEGVVYSAPRGDLELHDNKLPGAWEAEGSRPPKYIIGTAVTPGQRRGSGDRRAHLENVELNVDEITQFVLDLIKQRQNLSNKSVEAATSVQVNEPHQDVFQ